jgi:hypothetical protein
VGHKELAGAKENFRIFNEFTSAAGSNLGSIVVFVVDRVHG